MPCSNVNPGAADAVYQDLQCSAGYTGNLCGACAPGYGSTKPFVCRACLQRRALIGLYVLAGCAMLVLLLLLCRCTVTASKARAAQSASGKPPSVDLLRPLIIYINCLLIISNIGIEWPATLSYALQGLAWVWAVATPHTLSVDCILTPGGVLPTAIKKVLFYLCMPLAVLVIALLIQGVLLYSMRRFRTRSTAASSMLHYLAANAMVALMVFLPSLLNTMFTLFACITIDKPSTTEQSGQGTDKSEASSTVGSFWVYNVSSRCFVGYHLQWALGLGVPVVLLTCVVLPCSILWLTLKHRNDPGFYRHYSFLVQSYKPSFCYWEAVVIFQMIVLVAISVYGSVALGAFYSLIALNMVFAIIGMVLLGVRPYAHAKANAIATMAVCCLLFTSYIMLTFLPYGGLQAPTAYTTAMGVTVVVVNVAFILYVVWCILRAVEWKQAGQAGLKVIQSSIDLTTSLSRSFSLSSLTNSFSIGSGNQGASKSPGQLPQASSAAPGFQGTNHSGLLPRGHRCACLEIVSIRCPCCGARQAKPDESVEYDEPGLCGRTQQQVAASQQQPAAKQTNAASGGLQA